MTNKEKRFLKLLALHGEGNFREIKTLLNCFGYKLIRVRGSHFLFHNDENERIMFPVHNNKIKKHYIPRILKQIYGQKEI